MKRNQLLIEKLKKTASSWAGDDWKIVVKKRRKVELAASKKRRAQ